MTNFSEEKYISWQVITSNNNNSSNNSNSRYICKSHSAKQFGGMQVNIGSKAKSRSSTKGMPESGQKHNVRSLVLDASAHYQGEELLFQVYFS